MAAKRLSVIALAVSLGWTNPAHAQGEDLATLQLQIAQMQEQMRGQMAAMLAMQQQIEALQGKLASATNPVPATSPLVAAPTPQPAPLALAALGGSSGTSPTAADKPKPKAWYDRLQLRGYTQLRFNEIISGDKTAPAGQSRLRSVHDGSISDRSNFSLRRVRVVLQGEISDRVSLYLQHDFASAVMGQQAGERREGFGQLRDAYADVFLDRHKTFKVRLGQSKVPYGWENMQSSSNRLTLDRSDGINSAVPGERDLGVIAYFTPRTMQKIWDELTKEGQKTFGNYGAFGIGLMNGQGTNKTEQDNALMQVALVSLPFRVGDQILEVGASAMRNHFRPELRSGGVSAKGYADDRIGVHAMLYPRPIGVQAEWNWGKGPEFDRASGTIKEKKLNGGYVQVMGRFATEGGSTLWPYARWQHYRGGWKVALNAPRVETDEIEVGLEWQAMKALELTLAYARMRRSEADERRLGRAEGNVLRTQIQWNY
ncbi:porin [Novosphingobium olei]|uniref:porin n=1 Tax=Novosphingobium olei TaxID=2728851 RepID=UPI00308C8C39|nr:porin [Novosphingobium olei]